MPGFRLLDFIRDQNWQVCSKSLEKVENQANKTAEIGSRSIRIRGFHMFFPCVFRQFSAKGPSDNLGHQPRGSALLQSNHSFRSQARWESPSFLCISMRKDREKKHQMRELNHFLCFLFNTIHQKKYKNQLQSSNKASCFCIPLSSTCSPGNNNSITLVLVSCPKKRPWPLQNIMDRH